MASLIGGAIRVILSPDQLNAWVQEALERENPPFAMTYATVNLSLSEGYWPRFGIEFSELNLVAKDPCVTRSEVSVDRLYFPLSIGGLFRGNLQFDIIRAGNLNIVLRDRVCDHRTDSPEASKDGKIVDNGPSPPPVLAIQKSKQQLAEVLSDWQSFFHHRWQKEVVNTREWLRGLRVSSVRVSRDKAGIVEERVVVSAIEVEIPRKGDVVSVQLAVKPKLKTSLGKELRALKASIKISKQNIRVNVKGQHKEGLLDLQVGFQVDKGLIDSALEIRQFPARELFDIAKKLKWIELQLDPRLMWFSCSARLQGDILAWRRLPVKLTGCALEGDLGKISLTEADIFPSRKELPFAPFTINFESLSLNKLLIAFGRRHYSGMMTDAGKVTGALLVSSPSEIQFSGKLQGLEFQFSRLGKKNLQKIPLIVGELRFGNERVSGVVKQIKIEGGQFTGDLSVNFDRELRSGVFQVNVEELKLSEDIQKLLVNGELNNVEIYGQGRIENSELIDWEGQIGIPTVVSEDWSIRGSKIKSSFSNHKFKAILRASELDLQESNDYQKWLRPLLLKYEGLGESIRFRKLYARIDIDEKGGRWSRAKASVDKAPILFSSHGGWQKSGQLAGEINVDFPKLKLLRWELSGSFLQPRVLPSSQMLKELAKKDPNLIVPASESPLGQLNFYKDIWSSERLRKIKSLGKRVIDTAKSMLPKKRVKNGPDKTNPDKAEQQAE